MKISVHLEADSIEEFQSFFTAFHVRQAVNEIPEEILKAVKGTPEVISAPMSLDTTPKEEPVVEAVPTPASAPAAEAPQEAPAEKPKRGRRPAEKPVEAAPVKPVPVAKTPEIVVTRQDLLDTFAEYVQAYGANFGYLDV